jgi:hypothetical protein
MKTRNGYTTEGMNLDSNVGGNSTFQMPDFKKASDFKASHRIRIGFAWDSFTRPAQVAGGQWRLRIGFD